MNNTLIPNNSIIIVIGTRAQLIKMAPIMQCLNKRNINYWFIYTAQHTVTIDDMIKEFGLKPPDINLNTKGGESNSATSLLKWGVKVVISLWKLKKLVGKNGVLLTHGDTFSTVWGAILGKFTKNQVMHIESGLRSFNIFNPFPEELNRLIVFRFTDIFVCPNTWAQENIKRYNKRSINTSLNTLYDSVRHILSKQIQLQIKVHRPYVLFSSHRFENINTKKKLEHIIEIAELMSDVFDVYFVLHPFTEKQLLKFGLIQRTNQSTKLHLIPRMNFTHFIKLGQEAEFIATDGGSNQEEFSYLGKPTLLLRKTTERVEGLSDTACLSNLDMDIITQFMSEYKKYSRPPLLIKTSPSLKIVETIQELL